MGATTAAVAVALMVPVVNVMCVASFVAAGTLGRASLGKSALALAKNPLVVAPVIGIAISAAGIGVPTPLENLCRILGAAAAPGALFALGLFLVGQRVTAGMAEVERAAAARAVVRVAVRAAATEAATVAAASAAAEKEATGAGAATTAGRASWAATAARRSSRR